MIETEQDDMDFPGTASRFDDPLSRDIEPERRGVRKLDLLDVLLIFARRKWVILRWVAAGVVIAIIAILRAPTLYRAEVTIMPPQQEQSSAALLGQLGALTALAGGGGVGLKSPSDLYIAILQTNLVADNLVDRFHLTDVYKIPDRDGAAGMLHKRSKFIPDKSGLIHIRVEDKDAKRAVALANGYADELFEQNNRLAIGSASQRRKFYQQQLAEEKDHLADAEVALKQTQNLIAQEANMQANISAHEVQLGALLSSSTEQNPEVVRLRTELAGLREQLKQLQHGSSDDVITQREFPAAGLEYIRKQRDVEYHQTLYDLLARQLEAARIDEAKASPDVQVIDPPLLPKQPSWPRPFLFILLGLVLGVIVGCIRVAVLYLYDYADTDPRLHERFVQVKRTMRLRG
jgi:uncharacterized protein involved in exopolysaccharide biosynthesis